MSEKKKSFDDRMRSGESAPLKDVFDRILKAYQWDKKYNELEVLSQWEEMMGKAVAIRTTRLYIENRVLFVELNSSVMREELQYGKEIIIQRVNQTAGQKIIDDVFFR